MQNCTVIRSAESTIAQKQDIADLFDFLMGLYEAILQSRRSRQQRVHDLLTLFREGAHCLHAALRSAQFGHRDHLHSLGYLLGVLHAFYSRANARILAINAPPFSVYQKVFLKFTIHSLSFAC